MQWSHDLAYREWKWDRRYSSVEVEGSAPTGPPDWILLQESPLPSDTQGLVKALFKENHYALIQQFKAFSPRQVPVYDLEDAFFAPYASFGGVQRPGPNFYLYSYQGPIVPRK